LAAAGFSAGLAAATGLAAAAAGLASGFFPMKTPFFVDRTSFCDTTLEFGFCFKNFLVI
jgi:hypothetical protein